MSPRVSNAEAAETRDSIISAMVDLSSLEGLESVSIAHLAEELGMSKAGVIGPFGDKETLQLAAVESAAAIFRVRIWDPAAKKPRGLPRLKAITGNWINYLEGDVFPGGCFMAAASTEFDGRLGPVRTAVEQAMALWDSVLESEVAYAVEQGDMPADTDPKQVAFEIGAIAVGVNQARQLRNDESAGKRGRRAMRRALGLSG